MISSGHLPSNPAEPLASAVMDDFLEELRKVADFVLLDTPPSLVVSDALGLAPKADGTLVVVDAATTHRSALSHLRSQLDRVGGTVIGSILNNLDRQKSKYYDRYKGYYQAGERYKAMDEAAVVGPSLDAERNGHTNGNGSGGRTSASSDRRALRSHKRTRTRRQSAESKDWE